VFDFTLLLVTGLKVHHIFRWSASSTRHGGTLIGTLKYILISSVFLFNQAFHVIYLPMVSQPQQSLLAELINEGHFRHMLGIVLKRGFSYRFLS
jgi:hypothetical protein